MKEFHYIEFLLKVEQISREVIRRCFPTSWHEDHITYTLADEMASQLKSVRVLGLDRTFNMIWDARKLRGSAEQSLGDLAVVVRLRTWAGEELEGVGLVEAKKREAHKASFEALRKGQLQRILRNAPSSQLLLYDYSEIGDFRDNLLGSQIWHSHDSWEGHHRHVAVIPSSHCVTLPTSVVEATGIRTTALYKFSIPFSVQLCARYLRGFDLEHRTSAVSKVERFINQNGGPRTLLLVGVSTDDAEPRLPEWVNYDLYGPIRQ